MEKEDGKREWNDEISLEGEKKVEITPNLLSTFLSSLHSRIENKNPQLSPKQFQLLIDFYTEFHLEKIAEKNNFYQGEFTPKEIEKYLIAGWAVYNVDEKEISRCEST